MSCLVVMSARLGTPFWAHFWAHRLRFFRVICQKTEVKRGTATVFQTVVGHRPHRTKTARYANARVARWDEAWKLSAVDASQWEEIRNVLGEEAQLAPLIHRMRLPRLSSSE